MDWLSIDTDISENDKVQFLLNDIGPEAYGVWNLALTKVAKEIDIDNEKNGYLTAPGDRDPVEFLSLSLNYPEEKVEKIFDSCAEFGLVDPEKWEDGKLFFPNLLSRTQVKNYLQKQRSGRKGGKNSKPSKRTGSGREADEKRTGSGPEANGKRTGTDKIRLDKDKDKNNKNTNPESEDSEDFSKEALREEYSDKAVEFTERMIEGVKNVNGKANTPEPETKTYKKWVQAFNRLNRIGPAGGDEGYEWERLEEILSFAFKDEFWHSKVASPIQLRKKGNNGLSKIVNIENSMNDDKYDNQAQKEWHEDAV